MQTVIPQSKVASLSSGHFVGMVAHDPDCKIGLKAFHCSIINDYASLQRKEKNYPDIPVSKRLDTAMEQQNYLQVKYDVQKNIQAAQMVFLNTVISTHNHFLPFAASMYAKQIAKQVVG